MNNTGVYNKTQHEIQIRYLSSLSSRWFVLFSQRIVHTSTLVMHGTNLWNNGVSDNSNVDHVLQPNKPNIDLFIEESTVTSALDNKGALVCFCYITMLCSQSIPLSLMYLPWFSIVTTFLY